MMDPISDKLHRINYLTAEMDTLYHQAALKLNLADSVMYVLYTILDKGGFCLLSDICKQTGISKQTINSAIRKLENEDVLYLEQYKGKSKKVCLTDKGKLYVQQTVARLYEAEGNAFKDWTEDEVETYIHLMEKFSESLCQQIESL